MGNRPKQGKNDQRSTGHLCKYRQTRCIQIGYPIQQIKRHKQSASLTQPFLNTSFTNLRPGKSFRETNGNENKITFFSYRSNQKTKNEKYKRARSRETQKGIYEIRTSTMAGKTNTHLAHSNNEKNKMKNQPKQRQNEQRSTRGARYDATKRSQIGCKI